MTSKGLVSEKAFLDKLKERWLNRATTQPHGNEEYNKRCASIMQMAPRLMDAACRCHLNMPLDDKWDIESLGHLDSDLSKEILYFQLTKVLPKYGTPKKAFLKSMRKEAESEGLTLAEPSDNYWLVLEWLVAFKILARYTPPYAGKYVYRLICKSMDNIDCPNCTQIIQSVNTEERLGWIFKSNEIPNDTKLYYQAVPLKQIESIKTA